LYGRSAARRVSTLLHKEKLGMSKKRKEVVASVLARLESSGLEARTLYLVAEIGRRRLASNTLGIRVPKRTDRGE